MQMRPLGRSGLTIAPVVFGGNVFGWTADEATSFRLLDAFVDAGFNTVDTADVYSRWAPGRSGGESETIIGRWLKQSGKRDKVLIATKSAKWDRNPGLSPASLRQAVDDALERLRTDVIDLFQAHQFDPDVPQEETLGAFAELIAAGKIRAIGASNFTAAQLEESLAISAKHGLPRYESLQPHYNLVERADYEATLEPLIRREEIGVIPYYSLASGFLTGKYRKREDLAGHARGGGAGRYLDDKGRRVLAALDEVADKHDVKPVHVALAWLQARPGISAPIASATSIEQLHEVLASASLSLDAEDIERLDAASTP
ncbi:MAG TPA: aldo/keto reductase [Rhodanobacteraceae bacterium]|nr:aldo/keto reductase [Rhodanobacteraceae bacterium]